MSSDILPPVELSGYSSHEREDLLVEACVAVARHHVPRVGYLDHLGVRDEACQVSDLLGPHDIAIGTPNQQGRHVNRRGCGA